MKHPDDIDGILDFGSIAEIWYRKKTYMPYPEVLYEFIDFKAKNEKWPERIKDLAIDISSLLQRLDPITRYANPHFFEINQSLILRYLELQKEFPTKLKKYSVIRFIGKFFNIEGLCIAASLPDEFKVEGVSVKGIERADNLIRIIADTVKQKIKRKSGFVCPLFYIENRNELGGLLLLNENLNLQDVYKFFDNINEKCEEIIDLLSISNIENFNPDSKNIGVNFVLGSVCLSQREMNDAKTYLEDKIHTWQEQCQTDLYNKFGNQKVKSLTKEILKKNKNVIFDIMRENEIDFDYFDSESDSISSKFSEIGTKQNRLDYVHATLKENDWQDSEDFFNKLIQLYEHDANLSPFHLEDLDTSLLYASRNCKSSYLIIGYKTANRLYDEKFNPDEDLIKEISSCITSTLSNYLKLNKIKDYGLFSFSLNNIQKKNFVSIIIESDSNSDSNEKKKTIQKIYLDLSYNMKKSFNIECNFAHKLIPDAIWHPDSLQKFKANLLEELINK